jgi:hypothetical protein
MISSSAADAFFEIFSLPGSCRGGERPARALAFTALAMVGLLALGASPAAAQQCPNSGANCNVTSGTLVINTSPNAYGGNTNVVSGATLDIVSGGRSTAAGR